MMDRSMGEKNKKKRIGRKKRMIGGGPFRTYKGDV
jgi:hypothetical protein